MWRVLYKKSFEKDLRKLPKNILTTIILKIDKLSLNPNSVTSKKLIGYSNYYRFRVGDYRVVYEKRESELVLVMISGKHRKDIYKKLKL